MPTVQSRRVLKIGAVIEKTGLGRDTIYRLGREGRFPRPIKLSERASGWIEQEVDAFLAKRAAERTTLSAIPRRGAAATYPAPKSQDLLAD